MLNKFLFVVILLVTVGFCQTNVMVNSYFEQEGGLVDLYLEIENLGPNDIEFSYDRENIFQHKVTCKDESGTNFSHLDKSYDCEYYFNNQQKFYSENTYETRKPVEDYCNNVMTDKEIIKSGEKKTIYVKSLNGEFDECDSVKIEVIAKEKKFKIKGL